MCANMVMLLYGVCTDEELHDVGTKAFGSSGAGAVVKVKWAQSIVA